MGALVDLEERGKGFVASLVLKCYFDNDCFMYEYFFFIAFSSVIMARNAKRSKFRRQE